MPAAKRLHVVSFQNPSPPDYGGVIDVYYKLKALKDAGIEIILHTFIYHGRTDLTLLKSICKEIHTYPRATGLKGIHPSLPYIVWSRRSPLLLKNLLKDTAPILFEGLHTSFYATHPALSHRIKILRAHNVEHDYYQGLAKAEKSPLKRFYYIWEARRLKKYEAKVLPGFDAIGAITPKDLQYFQAKYPDSNIFHLPCFFNSDTKSYPPAHSPYVLYHANLSVAENIEAALRIIEKIAPACPEIQFVIAGKDPAQSILSASAKCPNISVIANPSHEEMDRLIGQASKIILLTNQATGIKIKLLESLVRCPDVICNSKMVEGTGLERFCKIADTDAEILQALKEDFPATAESPIKSLKLYQSEAIANLLAACQK